MSDFLELSEKRFSARKFTDQAVSGDDLEYILNSTRLAPSACNRQPWKFIVVASEENKTKLQECYDREWFKTAPVYIICMKNTAENWIRPYDNKPHGDIDAAIATEHRCLAAAERGLGTCWVCNYDTEKMSRYFSRPDFEAIAIIPVGHIAEDCPHAAKVRKKLEDIAETI